MQVQAKNGAGLPKLIVCDVDGTIVDYDETITNDFKQLACMVKQYDLPLTIASGRGPDELGFFSLHTNSRIPIIVNNGAGAILNGKPLWGTMMDPAAIKPAVLKADEMGMFIHTSDGWNSTVYRMNDYARRHVEELGRNYVFHTPGPAEWEGKKMQKVLITDPQRPGRIDEILAVLQPLAHQFSIVRYDDRSADIMPAGCTKQAGLARLLDWLHLDKSQVMAIGDGRNDIGMLQMVGIGVAVANAHEDLKQVAGYVCQSPHAQGVIEAIERFYIQKLPQVQAAGI